MSKTSGVKAAGVRAGGGDLAVADPLDIAEVLGGFDADERQKQEQERRERSEAEERYVRLLSQLRQGRLTDRAPLGAVMQQLGITPGQLDQDIRLLAKADELRLTYAELDARKAAHAEASEKYRTEVLRWERELLPALGSAMRASGRHYSESNHAPDDLRRLRERRPLLFTDETIPRPRGDVTQIDRVA